MGERILVFVNPIAGRGRGSQIAQRVQAHLATHGYEAELITSSRQGYVREVREPAMAAVIIGGDGTVRAVTEHLLADLGDQMPAILPVPMGTANLMGRHLKLRWRSATLLDRLLAAVRRRRIRWIDAAQANGDLFLLLAGVGIDGHIVHTLDKMRNGPITYYSYALPAAHALGWYNYPPLTVVVDGKTVLSSEPAMAFVGNVSEHGVGFPLLPHAQSNDRLLDVCVIPCQSWPQAIGLFLHAAAGEHLLAEGVQYLSGTSIQITSDRPVPLQVDGEAAGYTPVDIGLLPRRVPFIVPLEAD